MAALANILLVTQERVTFSIASDYWQSSYYISASGMVDVSVVSWLLAVPSCRTNDIAADSCAASYSWSDCWQLPVAVVSGL